MVMEVAEDTLEKRLRRGVLSPREVAAMARDISAAHGNHIRDAIFFLNPPGDHPGRNTKKSQNHIRLKFLNDFSNTKNSYKDKADLLHQPGTIHVPANSWNPQDMNSLPVFLKGKPCKSGCQNCHLVTLKCKVAGDIGAGVTSTTSDGGKLAVQQ